MGNNVCIFLLKKIKKIKGAKDLLGPDSIDVTSYPMVGPAEAHCSNYLAHNVLEGPLHLKMMTHRMGLSIISRPNSLFSPTMSIDPNPITYLTTVRILGSITTLGQICVLDPQTDTF